MAISFCTPFAYCYHDDVGQFSSTRLCYQIKWPRHPASKNTRPHQNQPTWKLSCPHQHQSCQFNYI